MSETILEMKIKDGVKNDDNSWFSTTYGEPIKLEKGSTINYLTSFIDLGTQSDVIIELPTNLKLGIDFYRYEYDSPKVPSAFGTDAPIYTKRGIYYTINQAVLYNEIESPYQDNTNTHINQPKTTFGWKSYQYQPSGLPAFLLRRNGLVNDMPNLTRTETFVPDLQTAYIIMDKGSYTKNRFIQTVNDKFNLITGNFTDATKAPENKNPTSALDYKIPPNSSSELLKVYQYPYSATIAQDNDPLVDLVGDTNPLKFPPGIYINDLTWSYWFFPVFLTPSDDTFFIDENYLPYIWWANNQSGFFAGTTKFNLNYDDVNSLFYIDYCHSPIIDQNQKEVVVFSRQKQAYTSGKNAGNTAETVGYKSHGSMGGILIGRLFSQVLDDNYNVVSNDNSGFWQDTLGFGFDDDDLAQFQADFQQKTQSFYYNGISKKDDNNSATGATYTFNITYPHPKYLLTNTTDALVPIQWLQQSNYTVNTDDLGMSTLPTDIPKVFESIGNRAIYGDKTEYDIPKSHFLIEVNISHLRNDNYRDKDSYYQIMSIAGKTYSSGTNYIQTFDDGSVQALNIEEDIYIDKIEIRILNPDKSLAVGLGTNSTFFLKLTQPVVLGV